MAHQEGYEDNMEERALATSRREEPRELGEPKNTQTEKEKQKNKKATTNEKWDDTLKDKPKNTI